jgi:hypothetical protein
MWLRLQARKLHARPSVRRPFPKPFRKTFRLLRGCSRSHTAALQNTSPHEPSVRFTSDVAAPAGAEISRPASRPKAVPRAFPKDFPSSPRLQPQPHRCALEHLAVRAFGEIHLRCGCACRRGNFTPSLPAEGRSPSLSERLCAFSSAAAAATPLGVSFRPKPWLRRVPWSQPTRSDPGA